MTETLIEVRELAKTYYTEAGEIPVLHGINMDIQQGEFVAIMGASGSGKSTFMNILGCLDKASSGEYRLAGQVVANLDKDALAKLRNRVIGFVFQGFNLLSRTTLADNVALPLVYAQVGRAERQQRAEKMLEKVGLARFFHHRPNQISGGQQQRVAIARALVNNPTLILADEPTGNLDTKTSAEVMSLFCQLNDEGITVILVTHEQDIATFAKRLIRFSDGEVVEDIAISNRSWPC
ncbi:MAG: ABC transporter ATP-binding protein [Agitococcus sp.]|jgi:putative ABC transport system ATP-binding protein|nr:ABC transporter ATP-binding protein [Moraxellaceae bacterium]MDO8416708.1 ABC transporter ATP-binding protein [Agitococcus sp.]MDO9179754.1 ABC transporter ATP-binding protein [Agitococcus sp.]TQC97238.1 ABC transporter ATP-binding protein [Moraxellaceae bacterium AER2_44_116]